MSYLLCFYCFPLVIDQMTLITVFWNLVAVICQIKYKQGALSSCLQMSKVQILYIFIFGFVFVSDHLLCATFQNRAFYDKTEKTIV